MWRMGSSAILGGLALSSFLAGGCGDNGATTGTGGDTGSGGSGGTTTTTTTTDSTTDSTTTDSTTSTPTVDNGMPSDVYPAPHPEAPQVVSSGGPILKAPKIYPVYFAGDDPDLTAKLTDFAGKMGPSKFWAANTEEYGVGPIAVAPPIELAEEPAAKLDDLDIRAWLVKKLNADDPAFAGVDENAIVTIYYPASTTITLGGGVNGLVSCVGFGGYHYDMVLDAAHGGKRIAYAVLPRCEGFLQGATLLDELTASTSHEWIEAVTDPYPSLEPAYTTADEDHYFWTFAVGVAEIGDMCALNYSSYATLPELGYLVQKSWSNKAAAAGHNPCVPQLPGEVYFNSALVLPDEITLKLGGAPKKMHGLIVPVGESRTIDVLLFSDAKTPGPWKVHAYDKASLYQVGTSKLKFSWDRDTGVNGEKLHLTVEALAKSNSGELIYLYSKLGDQTTMWLGFVKN